MGLHRERGAERRTGRAAAAAGVVHDALRDGVVAAAATERYREARQLELDAAGEFERVGGPEHDAAEEVHGDRVEAQPGVDERSCLLTEPDTDAVQLDAGRGRDRLSVHAEEVDDDARRGWRPARWLDP